MGCLLDFPTSATDFTAGQSGLTSFFQKEPNITLVLYVRVHADMHAASANTSIFLINYDYTNITILCNVCVLSNWCLVNILLLERQRVVNTHFFSSGITGNMLWRVFLKTFLLFSMDVPNKYKYTV